MFKASGMTGEQLSGTQWLVTEECSNCHILFAVPEHFRDTARRDPEIWFYCPNGHRLHYNTESVEAKLRAAEARETALRDQLQASAAEAETTRVTLLRERQRFANGVCPCCNRSFENVRRHMATKHPNYDVTRVDHKAPRYGCSCGRSFESFAGLRRHQSAQRRDDWALPTTSRWSAHLTRI